MKIIIITPPVPPIFARHIRERYVPFPLGIAYLGAVLKERGYDVELIYSGYENLGGKRLMRIIENKKPDILGFSVLTPHLERAVTFATEIKRKYPNIKTIIGNVHATSLPEETLNTYPAFDFLLSGEGEISLPQLITSIAGNGKSFFEVPGLAFRYENKVHFNGEAPGVNDLDELPFPAWNLFFTTNKLPIGYKPLWLTVHASRGCPYKCVFCKIAEDKKMRYRKGSKVAEEINDWDVLNFNAKYLTFTDSTFTLNEEKVTEVLESMIKKNIGNKVKWECLTRVDRVNSKILNLMKKAGCDMIVYGTESGSYEILNNIKKTIDFSVTQHSIKITHEAGIKTTVSMLIGNPNETKETLKKTIEYALKLNPTIATFPILMHFPGTEVEKMAKEGKGSYIKISDKNIYSRWSSSSYHIIGLTATDLEAYQRKGFLKFYLRLSKIPIFLKNQDATGLILYLCNVFKRLFPKRQKSEFVVDI